MRIAWCARLFSAASADKYFRYGWSFSFFRSMTRENCCIAIRRNRIGKEFLPFVLQSKQADLRDWWLISPRYRKQPQLNWRLEGIYVFIEDLWWMFWDLYVIICRDRYRIMFLCLLYQLLSARWFGGFDWDWRKAGSSARWLLCHVGWSEGYRRAQDFIKWS